MNKLFHGVAAAAALTVGGMAIPSGPALATAIPTVCPATSFTNPATTPPNCNLVITFNTDGSITTSIPVGATSNYDGTEDALIGVFNNSSHTVTSFSLTGSNIFGFDGDGIDTFTGVGPVAGNPDTTGYGGPNGFFTNIVGNTGTVNFAGGIAAGGQDYFSLEEPASLDIIVNPTPEPATMLILGAALAGLGVVRRRKN